MLPRVSKSIKLLENAINVFLQDKLSQGFRARQSDECIIRSLNIIKVNLVFPRFSFTNLRITVYEKTEEIV